MLVFYCGLEGWDFQAEPALYLVGYFEILVAGKAREFSRRELQDHFSENFHVRHPPIFEQQEEDLVLVKGTENSRLLSRAVLMSDWGEDRAGRLLKVLSEKMQVVFGDFEGKISFQRSPTRWVDEDYVQRAVEFMRSLE
jgi:hypothetical protein